MRKLKKAVSLLLAALLCASVLVGCADGGDGVSLSVSVGSRVTTLDPIYAEDINSQTVLVHLYENLMKVAPDGAGGAAVVNGMAKSVDVEENFDGTVTYTFRLRSARWSDGQSVRASDFVYAWQRLADPDSYSPYAALLSVVCGYEEARAAGDMSLLQVTAKNASTLVVTLSGNYDWFLREVCTSPATMPLRQDVVQRLKEAGIQAAGADGEAQAWWSDPTALVTNGPYLATGYQFSKYLELTASERYNSDQLGPETLTFRFAEDADKAWELYENKEVDAVWPLPQERLAELAADETWSAIPQLGTYTVVYNCGHELLEDVLIPEQYEERCQQARETLGEAGYDRGSALGELEYLYVEEGTNGAVAQELCRQWQEALGITVVPKGVTTRELWSALRKGEYTLAGVDLEAAGNDAECFLMDWTSDSQDNVAGYENSAYDTLMAIIASAADGTARMGCLHDAEALLMDDFALSPLYTMGTAWELRDTLTGAARDARGWFNFSTVVARPS